VLIDGQRVVRNGFISGEDAIVAEATATGARVVARREHAASRPAGRVLS